MGNGIELICRCEHDAVNVSPNGESQMMNIKALNEWDSRVSDCFYSDSHFVIITIIIKLFCFSAVVKVVSECMSLLSCLLISAAGKEDLLKVVFCFVLNLD